MDTTQKAMKNKMKSYTLMILIIVIAFLLSLNTTRIFTLDELSLFLTVVGLIYGLIAAFTISNAWERFSSIRDAISEETYALTSAYIYSKQLSDKKVARDLKQRIIEYCKEVPTVEWHDYWHSEKTHKKFRGIIEAVSKIKFKTVKDSNLFDEITTEMEDAARSRNKQLILAQSRISKLQWILNIFLSVILVIGLTLAEIPGTTLSMFVTGSMITAILMILIVVYELDGMKVAEEEVSNEPYFSIIKILQNE